ncbi:MAG: electron transfer flavoprotein [Proteobacteria bacterium]|nr:electron transfer flavoprotein [Pseudomonadota bacterium]
MPLEIKIMNEDDLDRETVDSDVCFVGAGPACLAGAIHLNNLIEKHNEKADLDPSIEALDTKIVILEKGSDVGAHGISGAVLDPLALQELIPDWKERSDFPLEQWVERESMLVLTSEQSGIEWPFLPPELHDTGKPIISIARFQRWLADIASSRGVEILSGTAGWDLLYKDNVVAGVRTRDRGLDSDGSPKSEYEPGADVNAKITILGEGPRGHLSRILMEKYNMQDGLNEMGYEMGCKEVLQFPKGTIKEGFVKLIAGYPLGLPALPGSTFGGGFIYSMGDDKVCIGLLAVLDAHNPDQDVQYLLQKIKLHPKVKEVLGKGTVVKYGAKAVTVGGWGCMPKLYAPGAMIVGDSASFLNAVRIKGIHLAMKSGMLAAETAFEALLKKNYDEDVLKTYKTKVDESWIRTEMEPSRNFHTDISTKNIVVSGIGYLSSKILGGSDIHKGHEDHEGMKTLQAFYKGKLSQRPDMFEKGRYSDLKQHYKGADENPYIIDKLTAVYFSGSIHDEHQPCHLKVRPEIRNFAPDHCVTQCTEEYGNPCERFCPAQVYNILEDESAPSGKKLQVDFSNCVHCKTCDIRDPYQIIQWVPPEGGEGPDYDYL